LGNIEVWVVFVVENSIKLPPKKKGFGRKI
jgi:hypothetical protein